MAAPIAHNSWKGCTQVPSAPGTAFQKHLKRSISREVYGTSIWKLYHTAQELIKYVLKLKRKLNISFRTMSYGSYHLQHLPNRSTT